MARKKTATIAKEIEVLRRDIDHWRRVRTKRSAMPEELWHRAAKLATVYGVTLVSTELRLHYKRLKERAARVSALVPAQTTFIELDPVTVLDNPTGDVVVEVSGADGSAMSLHLKALESRDVAGLVEAFFRRTR